MIWYGWLGLLVLAPDQALLPWQIDPFARWFTPTMWTAYILLADALVLRRRGTSLIHDRPREALFMALVSIPLWLVFEAYNLRLLNWAYFGLPETPWVAALAYGWAFATITPGLWETAALLGASSNRGGSPDDHRGRRPEDGGLWSSPLDPPHLGVAAPLSRDAPPPPRPPSPPAGGRGVSERAAIASRALSPLLRASVAIGGVFLVVPPLLPAAVRPWTFGFVWLGFVLLLDPLNYRAGRPSFTAAWARGDRGFVYRWLLAGLLCGLLWEFWNYWAIGKWRYVGLPVFPSFKLFEMPLAGYLGFPPFALGAFAMYHLVRPLAGLPAPEAS